jgi:FlgN protein
MGLSEVSNVLWRERQLLELLLFKLEEEQLVLAAGRTRWLNHASREVEMVLDEIKVAEMARAIEVEALAAELGLAPGPSLRGLAGGAPDPWRGIFDAHRQAFLTSAHEILALAQVNREILVRGQKTASDTLSWLGGNDADSYAPAGSASAERNRP